MDGAVLSYWREAVLRLSPENGDKEVEFSLSHEVAIPCDDGTVQVVKVQDMLEAVETAQDYVYIVEALSDLIEEQYDEEYDDEEGY
jgi:hypothetical protein